MRCYPGKYRSFSGHCNNVEHPDWGNANRPFTRILVSRYDDGISAPRKRSHHADLRLPSPREVSLAVHQGGSNTFSHMTTVMIFFGEFIFHDIAHTVQSAGFGGSRIHCCGLKNDQLVHPECLPIKVPSSDPFMSSRINQIRCIEYVRSCSAIRDQCSLGPREQINQVSKSDENIYKLYLNCCCVIDNNCVIIDD